MARSMRSVGIRVAEEAVGQLSERLPEAIVSYAEPIGGEVVVRLRQFPKRLLIERNSGATMAPYQTASGLAVLAFAGLEVRQKVAWRHPFELEGVTTWRTEACLETFLAEARRKGMVLPPFCTGSRFKLAGLPCLSPSGKLLGVLGAAWHASSEGEDVGTTTVVGALREAGEALTTETEADA